MPRPVRLNKKRELYVFNKSSERKKFPFFAQILTYVTKNKKLGLHKGFNCGIIIVDRYNIKRSRVIATGNNKDRVIMNDRIRSKEVRLIDHNGDNHGVVSTLKAKNMAQDEGLDLVLISPNQDPPVAKIMDYGKYKYELEKKAKEAKKKQHTVDVKEVKMRYKIDTHDYQGRLKSAKKFLGQGNKVKVIVMLRGREMQHASLAFDLANRFLADLEGEAFVLDKKPVLEGRNVAMFLSPQ